MFRTINPTYIKSNIDCIIIVFDITDRNSFDNYLKWIIFPDIKNKVNADCLLVLVGSKLNLKFDRKVSNLVAEKLANENDMKYFEVITKSEENMERLFNYAHYILSKNL